MKIGKWGGLLLAAAMLLSGCGDFWQSPNGGGNGEYTLTNSGSISVAPGSTNQATITVTPENSFTGTVTLTCAVTTSPTSAVDPTTCSLSPSSVSISDTSAQTSTLTATTSGDTTTGAYEITITGAASGYSSETTTVCVEVSTSSGTCGSSSGGASGVFYVLDQTTDQIVATSVSSGVATENAYTLPTTDALAMTVAPNGQFLYVSTIDGIYLYTIGSGGALNLGNSGIAVSSDPAYTMQVDSTNSWLIDGISGIAQLNAIAINSSTGELAAAGESEQQVALPSSSIVNQLVISPNDSSSCGNCYVFVAMGSGGTELIHFNPANANPFGGTGTIPLISPAEGGSNTVAVDPSNRLLYVGETAAVSGTQTGGLRAFTYTSTNYTEISGSPYSSQGTGPISILPSADGNYVYVANQAVSGSTTDNIASFSVSSNSLTYIATATAGPAGRISLAEDSTQSYLLAVDFAGNPDLEGYSMSSGALTSLFTGTTGTDPVGAFAIAALP